MDSFSGISLRDIANLSPDSVAKLEAQLAEEFKDTSKAYLKARLSRISHNLESLRNVIGYITKQETQWTRKQKDELSRVQALKSEAENSALREDGTKYSRRREDPDVELQHLIDNLASPAHYDTILGGNMVSEVPFAEDLRKIISPIRAELAAIDQDNTYQEQLIRSITNKSVEILWEQYRQGLLDNKNRMIDETYEQLSNLEREYYDLVPNKIKNEQMDQYHKSVVPVTSIKRHHDELVSKEDLANSKFRQESPSPYNQDSHYSVKSRFVRNNRIEITNARREALESLQLSQRAFESSLGHSEFQLSASEVEDDILSIRKRMKISDETPLEEQLEEARAANEETPIPEESLEEKYKQLLTMEVKPQYSTYSQGPSQIFDSTRSGFQPSPPSSQLSDASSGKFVMPSIPPLDWFQSRGAPEYRFHPPVTLNGPAN
ncbi:hypothetical protein JA9_004779 [Meyerozyma sp. JA9]|nr:hypothetical protein JA9_004779 [Meyerozyma sp. JA9]